jgi:transcriptional regulator with XRE-family HTH domain
MDLKEIKYQNLLRIADRYKLKDAKLAAILGSTKQHANNLLKGKTSIGSQTIQKISDKLEFDKSEFFRNPVDAIPPQSPTPLLPDLVRTQAASIAEMQSSINRLHEKNRLLRWFFIAQNPT